MHATSLVSKTQHAGGLPSAILLALLLTSVSPVIGQVTLTCPADITVSNDPGVCSAVVTFPDPVVTGTNIGDVVTVTPPSGSTFPVGTNDVVVNVTDAATNLLASCTFAVTVADAEPPAITNVSLSKTSLWPPNHKLNKVIVDYDATDNCDPALECTLTVASSEAVDGTGDGNTGSDWEVVDAHRVKLRAERSGNGSGRTYTITVTCTDQAGNSASKEVTVSVPHDRGKHKGQQDDHGNGNGNGHGKGKNKNGNGS